MPNRAAVLDIIDLIPPGVVNHELTEQMLRLFNNDRTREWSMDELYAALGRPPRDFETRKTLYQLLGIHDARMTPEHKFAARRNKNSGR